MNHYCTYFDKGFVIQGLTLWRSLKSTSPGAVLWVLALDDNIYTLLSGSCDSNLRVISLHNLEASVPQLAQIKAGRSRVEYFFTLSPVLPLFILEGHPEIATITYLDADLFFFASPAKLFDEMERQSASAMIVRHNFPPWLRDLEKWGKFNVGILIFKNDQPGRKILQEWRAQCLDWCYDVVENDRFADQKYLDFWPGKFGKSVIVTENLGVNVAPWNWAGCTFEMRGDEVYVSGEVLIVYHFAKFRSYSRNVWDSGQLDFSVMPFGLRNAIYGRYWAVMEEVRNGPVLRGSVDYGRVQFRLARKGATGWVLRIVFGSVWLRIGRRFIVLGLPLIGRYSGQVLACIRNWRQKS